MKNARHTEYATWISAHYPTHTDAYGRCAEAVTGIVAAFPELTKVRGWVFDALWGRREHWWCHAPDGKVVDPTRHQFPCLIDYEVWDESKGEPPKRRVCTDCGTEHYGDNDFCNEACYRRYAAYLKTGSL